MFYCFPNFTIFFQVERDGKSLVEVEKEHSQAEVKHSHRVITINPSEGNRAQKVIMKKPTVEITRNIRPIYVRALGRNIGDLIETKMYVSAFTREISKTLGVLPINIIVGSKTSLSAFFFINSTVDYIALLGRDWIHDN